MNNVVLSFFFSNQHYAESKNQKIKILETDYLVQISGLPM